MVATGMSYFEIGITLRSRKLVRKMRMGYNLRVVLENCRILAAAAIPGGRSRVNYSFNVMMKGPRRSGQNRGLSPRARESIFGKPIRWSPPSFCIGLQPHTHRSNSWLEQGDASNRATTR